MWTTSWPGSGQPPDLQNYVLRPQITIIKTSKKHYENRYLLSTKEFQVKSYTKITHLFSHPLRKKQKNLSGCDVDNQLTSPFFATSHVCFVCFFMRVCVCVCVCVFFLFFFRSFLFLKFLFCFLCFFYFVSPCSSSCFPSYSSCFYYCSVCFLLHILLFFLFVFFLLFIFICFIFICFFFFISQRDRQKRQTSLMIDVKHSNVLVFLVLLMKQNKKQAINIIKWPWNQ